jgi:hypothetical protein
MTGKQSLNIIQKNSSAVITAIKPAQQLDVNRNNYNVEFGFIGMGGVIPEGANYCLIEVEDSGSDGLRFWTTGEDPTKTFGFRRFDKEFFDIEGAENIAKFKCYDTGENGNVKINVQFGVKK